MPDQLVKLHRSEQMFSIFLILFTICVFAEQPASPTKPLSWSMCGLTCKVTEYTNDKIICSDNFLNYLAFWRRELNSITKDNGSRSTIIFNVKNSEFKFEVYCDADGFMSSKFGAMLGEIFDYAHSYDIEVIY